MGLKEKLQRVGRYEYLLPAGVLNKRQRAVKFFLSETLYELLEEDAVLQAANAATLPGVVEPVVVMPDVHVGYGFPIGGVMATDPAEGGIISPGAIGYDINCGVRLIATNLEGKDVKKRLDSIMRALLHGVPAGVGSTSKIKLSKSKMKEVLRLGAKWAVSRGFGKKEDLEHAEGYGQLPFADPEAVSNEAYERGSDELGTVGSGNHFVEVQEVEEVYEPEVAKALGFHKGQVMIMVHSGSRGLGHQVATDYIKVALRASGKYRIELPDPELACVPLNSPEGQRYWGAMNAAANYAFANRQILGWISTSAVAKA
ncbi:MAG: RtcB family protein, partial [Aquificae bacterium]|nr:RtcB family protein [Aquificota bacterium]